MGKRPQTETQNKMAVESKELDDVVDGAPQTREQDGIRAFLSGLPGLTSALPP